MDRTIKKRITVNEYTIAKKELEIASLYISDAYIYIPVDLYSGLRTTQEALDELAQVMQNRIDNIKNSGQPEKNKEENKNG